jgi:hypothetical protein
MLKERDFVVVVWAICLIYCALRNIDLGLWVQTGGCLVSFCFHVYGFWNWKDKGIGD